MSEKHGYAATFDARQQDLAFHLQAVDESVTITDNLVGKHLWISYGQQERRFFYEKDRSDVAGEAMTAGLFASWHDECMYSALSSNL